MVYCGEWGLESCLGLPMSLLEGLLLFLAPKEYQIIMLRGPEANKLWHPRRLVWLLLAKNN